MEEIFNAVLNSIQLKGFAYLKNIDLIKFQLVNEKLGQLLYETHIKLDSSKSNVVYNPEEVLFHTDYPKAQIVSWFCIEPNNNEAPIELLDTNNFISFDNKILNSLREVDVYFKCKLTESQYKVPLIINYENKVGTTYNPWGIQESKLKNDLDYFYQYLENCSQYSFELEKADALFIDNHRLLHGRKEIRKNSKRHLIRHFIFKYHLELMTESQD